MLRILVDENIPLAAVRELEQRGHDVKDIRWTDLEGIPDTQIWKIARKDGC